MNRRSYYIIFLVLYVIGNEVHGQCTSNPAPTITAPDTYFDGDNPIGWLGNNTVLKCYYNCDPQPCSNAMESLIWSKGATQVLGHLWSSDPQNGIHANGYNASLVISQLDYDSSGNYSQLTWFNTSWDDNNTEWQCAVKLQACVEVQTVATVVVFDEHVYVLERTFDNRTLAEIKDDSSFSVAEGSYPVTFKVKSQPQSRLSVAASEKTTEETQCYVDSEYFVCELQSSVRMEVKTEKVDYTIDYLDPTTGDYSQPRLPPVYEDGYDGDSIIFGPIIALQCSTPCCEPECIVPTTIVCCIAVFLLIHVFFIYCGGPEYNRGKWKCFCCKKIRFCCCVCNCSNTLCEECSAKNHCSASLCKERESCNKNNRVADAPYDVPQPDYPL